MYVCMYVCIYSFILGMPPCENKTDFTHGAGFINTVVCPPKPKSQTFVPPVEDVLGVPGDPFVRFSLMGDTNCEDRIAGSALGTPTSGPRAPGFELVPGPPLEVNVTSVISTLTGPSLF